MIVGIPFEWRLAGLFVIGATLASVLNLAVYRLAWDKRLISPWSPPPEGAGARIWFDRVPIFGWLSLRRETPVLGRGFWIRPMLVELAAGLGLATLYWWDVDQQAILPAVERIPLEKMSLAAPLTDGLLHAIFLSHALLFSLMLVASLIDFDEKTIPDTITVPGMLLGLVLAAILPWSLLPASVTHEAGVATPLIDFLHVASPNLWPASLLGNETVTSLLIGGGCYALWCFWLLPRTWHGRYGARRALRYLVARIAREPWSVIVFAMWIAGTIVIATLWKSNPTHWAALVTSLVGMAVGGGTIWLVRLIGYAVLRREAMGFGDVTLMAMIGAFVGWQTAILVFFLAPAVGLVFGTVNWLLKSENEIPYGPFLCVATLAIVIRWADVWLAVRPHFSLGIWIPVLLGGCLVLMVVLLFLLQVVKAVLSPRD